MKYKPNFFIVGAAKSGTSSLANHLSTHPEILISPHKEPFYFTPDFGINNLDEYEQLFTSARDVKAIGEASTGYLYSSEAAILIKKYNAQSKIIISLRNPAKMAYSYWGFMRVVGSENKSFEESISEKERTHRCTEEFKKECRNWCCNYLYLERASYYQQVKTYIDLFGKKQVKVIIFEEYIKNPSAYHKSIFDFLGVDNSYSANLIAKNKGGRLRSPFINKHVYGKQYPLLKKIFSPKTREKIRHYVRGLMTKNEPIPPLNIETQNYLSRFFAEDIGKLESILDIEIKAWKCTNVTNEN